MKIKLLSSGAKKPTRADNGSAGLDLYVPKSTIIKPGRNVVPLDFAIQLNCDTSNDNLDAHIRPRSGFSAKGMEGYAIDKNGQTKLFPQRFDADVLHGTVDSSYRGNVGVIIKSYEKDPFVIVEGTRIAQMIIEKIHNGDFEEVDELSETSRGDGGFGHSGTR